MVKNLPASAEDTRDMGLIPGSGRSSKVGNGTPLQYSCLENPMDRGAWQATVHVAVKSRTWLSPRADNIQSFSRSWLKKKTPCVIFIKMEVMFFPMMCNSHKLVNCSLRRYLIFPSLSHERLTGMVLELFKAQKSGSHCWSCLSLLPLVLLAVAS